MEEKSKLTKKIDELYSDYLSRRLDLILEIGEKENNSLLTSYRIKNFDSLIQLVGYEIASKFEYCFDLAKSDSKGRYGSSIYVNITNSFVEVDFGRFNGTPYTNYVYCLNPDLNGYSVKKSIAGTRKLFNESESFIVNGKPLKVYNSKYAIVLKVHKNNRIKTHFIELIELKTNRVIYSSTPGNTFFNDFLFVDNGHISEKAYLFYNNSLYDISNYYFSKLKDKQIIDVKKGYNIYEYNDFTLSMNLKELMEKEREKDQEIAFLEEQSRAEEFLRQKKEATQKLIQKRDDLIQTIVSSTAIVEDCNKQLNYVRNKRFLISNLFIDKGNYRILNPLCFKIGLNNIDFSNASFEKVRIRGLDLRETNIRFGRNDFQIIDGRDLSNTNMEGLFLLPNTNFDDVIIKGARFSINNGLNVMNISIEAFKNAIYDDKTTINGIPLVELLLTFEEQKIAKKN